MMNLRPTLIFMIFMIAAPSLCAEPPALVQTEIAYLFSHMEKSGCEFNRNNEWHNATDASAHLQKKYQYLLRFDLISSAESFIMGAASESSISKKPYLVRCPGMPVIESGSWFSAALEKYRKTRGKPAH